MEMNRAQPQSLPLGTVRALVYPIHKGIGAVVPAVMGLLYDTFGSRHRSLRGTVHHGAGEVSGMGEPIVLLDEQRWIRSAQQGEVDAFNHLVERYQGLAYNVAYRTLGHAEDAADATQEAFLSAFRAIGDFRGGSFKGWLLRIVINACYDARRRSGRRPATSMDAMIEEIGDSPWADEHAPDPESIVLTRELREGIEKALDHLPDDQRVALALVDMQGLSYEEAADAMECPVGTIRSRLARARARVRDHLLAAGNFR